VSTTFSAPGKLIVAGEYAVLDDRPAIVAAIDRRATCTFEPGETRRVAGLGAGPFEVVFESDGIRFDGDTEDRLGLLRAVFKVARKLGRRAPIGTYTVDTSAFFHGDDKLGFGSSAAAAVCFAAALLDDGKRPNVERVHSLAARAHREFSSGGSGVDVACSSYGGVFRFERRGGRPPETAPVLLCPEGVDVFACFAGAPQSTRDYLEKVRAFAQGDRRRYRAAIDDVGYATLELLGTLRPDEDPRVFFAAIDRCRRAMRRFGDRVGIDVVSPPHRAIARVARAAGGAAKPSGAGGGDVAACFAPSARTSEMRAALEAAGYPTFDTAVGGEVEGVRRDG
jgi:phosphomevalonate kinase